MQYRTTKRLVVAGIVGYYVTVFSFGFIIATVLYHFIHKYW